MSAFSIGTRLVGEGAPTLIIAELSANHGGSLERALQTIEAAANAGADAIKIQTYTPDTLTLPSTDPRFIVKTKNAWEGRTLYDLYGEAMTPWEWHARLRDAAHAQGLLFFSTPFDPTAVEFLAQLGAPAFKIASFELVDLPLIEHAARHGKPMLLSTGMASLGEIEAAVATCRNTGNSQIALLRCVSSYPARPETMNLQSLTSLAAFGTVIGLSDHTLNATVAIAAVARGARIIEKHFILDRAVGGPDAFFSLQPEEFKAMVEAVRQTERAMGPTRFGPTDDERPSLRFRRSLFVTRPVHAGQVLTCDDIQSIRPSDGLPPSALPHVLGRVATRDLAACTPLSWDAVGERSRHLPVELRPAALDDGPLILTWRNDPQTRAGSLQRAEVPLEDHRAWMKTTLASATRRLFIACLENRPVGQLRLDLRTDGSWEVSLTIAPQERGKRLATGVLVAGEGIARSLGATCLVARIRVGNEASVRAFKAAGYYAFVEGAGKILHCERRLTPFASLQAG